MGVPVSDNTVSMQKPCVLAGMQHTAALPNKVHSKGAQHALQLRKLT
jgi:hypothetical protein